MQLIRTAQRIGIVLKSCEGDMTVSFAMHLVFIQAEDETMIKIYGYGWSSKWDTYNLKISP